MSQKPPAFQFYAKDWRSSPTIKQMSREERGDFITLLAASWDSDEPGTLPLPVELAAKCAGSDPRVVRNFLRKYPRTFEQVGSQLVNHKLHRQFIELDKRKQKQSLAGKKGNKIRWNSQSQPDSQAYSQPDRSASAIASASANKDHNPSLSTKTGDWPDAAKYREPATIPNKPAGGNGGWHPDPTWPSAPARDGVVLQDALTNKPIAKSFQGHWMPI